MMKGLQRVMGAVSARVPMPSLSNLYIKLEGNRLEMTATDLEVTITAQVDVLESEGSGSILIQAKRFQELIRELPDVQLDIEVPEMGKVNLMGDGIGNYTIPGGNPVEFPELPPVDALITFSLEAENLKRMISKTIFAVSNDEMRPVLTGLLLQVKPNEVQVVATDGHRLSKLMQRNINYNGDPINVIIPRKALDLLIRSMDDDDKPEISLAETRASFKTEKGKLITRLIDGHYPRYESVIPTSNPGRLTVKTDEIMAAARRVSIFASQLSKQVRLDISAESIILESEDQELGGRAKETVSVSYEGEPISIGYNANYLMDVLKQIDTEEVVFELGAADDAAVIRPTSQEEDEDFMMLLMPIRLK